MGLWIREIKRKSGETSEFWYGTVEHATGRRYASGKPVYRRETFSIASVKDISRRRAEKEYQRIKQLLLSRESQPLTADPALPDFVPQYISYCRDIIEKRSWDRDEQSLRFLTAFFGPVRLSEITPATCIQYQQHRKKEGRSNRTVNLELACLRHLINVARLQGFHAGDNPVSKVRFLEVQMTKDRVLSKAEEDRLMAASPAFLRDILTCALQTGMRRAEILFLVWENIDFDNNYRGCPR